LDEVFRLGKKSAECADEVVHLTRQAADELVLSNIFGLVALTDISVKYDPCVYATDASDTRGAFTSTYVGEELSSVSG
jgi:hypothetical protein